MTDKTNKITLAATGDILLHDRLYKKAKIKNGLGYDFSELLKEAEPLFKIGDLTIVNQESIIGGEELGLSNYPRFNSPIEIGYKLKEFGVDIVNLANNHVLDRGEVGLLKSIKNWNEIGLPYVGAYCSKEDQETVRIFHKNGLRVCFLSYTKRMAGVKIPHNKAYLVDSFEDASVGKVKKRIEQIKSLDVTDVIVLSVHFGKEYHMLPTSDQIEISNTLSDAGADIILGHHPHVLQPPNYIWNSRGKETFVIYSLGNFFSGQKGINRQIGAFFTIDIEKASMDSQIKIGNPTIKLTYVDSCDKKTYKIHLLEDVVKGQEKIITHVGEFRSQDVYDKMINHMRKWIPDLNIS
ncbi:CapA family protein [Evansella tamaricis]|uniref:CapA family protein n=1 Tax=Evansella tamaricis TaxID=2069301 RepID=A0ABS6JHF3_9BACI|nr:CapA family protein [Evansella tamaricis]MBU9712953.1 CapA family protein [Evansella tamaricis]